MSLFFRSRHQSVCCFLQNGCGKALYENVIVFQPVMKVCVGGRVGCENVWGNWEHNKQWVGQGRSGGHIREGRTGTNLSLTLFGNLRRDTVTITFSWFIAQDSVFNQEKRSHVMRIDIWYRKRLYKAHQKNLFSTSCGSSLIIAEAFIWILASIWLTSTLSPYKSALWASLCEKGIRTVILAAASPNVVTLASFSSRPLEPPAQLERQQNALVLSSSATKLHHPSTSQTPHHALSGQLGNLTSN